MKKKSYVFHLITGLIFFSIPFYSRNLSANAFAQKPIEFTNKELDALLVLIKPEKNKIELNGKTLFFTPSPSLLFFGVDEVEEKIDLSFIGNMVDLHFEHLKADVPKINFLTTNELEVRIPLRDNNFAVKSLLGSIQFKSVSLVATLHWRNGDTAFSNTLYSDDSGLEIKNVQFQGKITGKGLLAAPLILNKLKRFSEKKMYTALHSFLMKDTIRESILNGLLRYSEFQTGEEAKQISREGVQFFSNENASGIRYQVE